MNKARGKLFILSAPSGTGKGTLIKELLKHCPDTVLSVSFTTRPPREEEVHGQSYYFISREEFEHMIGQGYFFEYAQYVGHYYGTPKKPIHDALGDGKDVVLEIETQGARQVKEAMPEAVSIFILPPDIPELERRLKGRGTDTIEACAARLERAMQEIGEMESYDYAVVNEDVRRAAKEIFEIFAKERNE